MREGRDRLPEFDAALELAHAQPANRRVPQPKCVDEPSAYVDYVSVPDADTARALCRGCELLDLCRASALIEKPAWGVQGGIAWVSGRQYHLRRTATYEDADLEDIEELVPISAQNTLDPAA